MFSTFRVFGKNESGSATIEATVSLTAFIFFVVTILSILNYCRLQTLISSALNCTAKEMSQYSYLYKASGLKKHGDSLADKSEAAKKNVNSIIDTSKVFLTASIKGFNYAKETADEIGSAVSSGDIDKIGGLFDSYDEVMATGTANVEAIKAAYSAAATKFGDIAKDPMAFMTGIAHIAASEGVELLKSHLIAAPLAKAMSVKHFGENKDEADQKLKSLGVKDGLDGLNFGLSTLFAKDTKEDICIVAVYQIKMIQLLNLPIAEVTLCKRAVTRAWLGGDNYE